MGNVLITRSLARSSQVFYICFMEIEPEHIPPPRSNRRAPPPHGAHPPRGIGMIPLVLWGALALVLGGILLYFVFWLAIIFTAVGLILMGINFVRGLFSGKQNRKTRHTIVRFHIDR